MCRLARVWVGLVLLVALSGCTVERAAPERVVVRAPTREAASSAGWRYVPQGERLELPTATVPVPPTRRVMPVVERRGAVVESVPATLVAEPGSETRGCEEHYRDLLGEQGPRPVFGAEVAWRLSEELLEARPECLEEGWAPELGLEVQCQGPVVGGLSVSEGLLRYEGQTNRPRLGPTGRDQYGNVLLHFRRLPLTDGPGCWYYQVSRDTWGWQVMGGASGVAVPEFPACEAMVRERVTRGMLADLGTLHVARVVDEVRREHGAECGSGLWRSYPRRAGYSDCGIEADTGVTEDGAMVVNWHERQPALGGVVCWIFRAGGDGWEEYAARPAEEG